MAQPNDTDALMRGFRRMQEFSESLAASGWTIPLWGSFGDIANLYQDITNENREPDEAFLAYYDDRPEELDGLKLRVVDSSFLEFWRPLLVESVAAFDAGLFRVVVPTLVLVTEGAFAKSARQFKTKTNVQNYVRAALAKLDTDAIHSMAEISISAFLLALFENHRFAYDEPSEIKRNWILHGRASPDWGREHGVKLLQALDYFAMLDGE